MTDAELWNASCSPGTHVVLREDNGSMTKTQTRSHAWMLGAHAVVLVEGRAGGYLVNRLMAVEYPHFQL